MAPEPRQSAARYCVQCGFDQRTVVGYEAMRATVRDMSLAVWDAAGQPLDTAWPRAAAEEHKWTVIEDGLREVRLPNGVEILIADLKGGDDAR